MLLAVLWMSGIIGTGPEFKESAMVCHAVAKKTVSSQAELERALAAQGELQIILKGNITVDRLLRVRGKKTIYGGKYRIRRKAASGNTYKGTLIYMQGNSLRLSSVVLEGNGKSERVSGDINGKLIEVAAGTLILDSGTKLSSNYNFSSYTDGGGGITVHDKGQVIMKPGSVISDHLSMTGGSGVRIEQGGVFIMEGGTIRDNIVVGQRNDSGFDGRGGAIHNRGTVWIKDGAICGNFARGYVKNGQACGGYGGAIYNQGTLRITGGMIRDNQASFGGGAIYTNERGNVLIEGGEISFNQAEGQRGGGIYLSAASEIVMSGGSVRNNTARHGTQIFIGSMASGTLFINGGSIQGEADAVYANGGRVVVSGGEVKGECALRNRGVCEIRNGTLEGTEYGICYDAGTILMSGSPSVNRIYLGRGMALGADRGISLKAKCELCPADYKEGRSLVKIISGESAEVVKRSFSLKKKKRFTLESGREELHIGRERYEIEFMPNGGSGSMKNQTVYVDEEQALTKCSFWREDYGFAGWSDQPVNAVKKEDIRYKEEAVIRNLGEHGDRIRLYALWVKKPVLKSRCGMFSFYEGENVTREILLFGMSAEDEQDGDLTGEIQIKKVFLPDGSECGTSAGLPTGQKDIGKGKIHYQVTNSFGISGTLVQDYEIMPNQRPELIVNDRYFFVSDDRQQEEEHVKADISQNVAVVDDTESEMQLKKEMEVSWGELDIGEEGCYKIRVSVRDQYGNRFYMSPGEERRYGFGKRTETEFTVTVVQPENKKDSERGGGYVRFVSRDFMEILEPCSLWRTKEFQNKLEESFQKQPEQYEEIWRISGEDKRKIKAFAHHQEDPFSKETNDLFLERFGYLKKRG